MSPVRAPLLAAGLFAGLVGVAIAQTPVPFDMSLERDAVPAAPAPDDTLRPSFAQTPPAAGIMPMPPAIAGGWNRAILPFDGLTLEGEIDSRTWSLDLTSDQAASPATVTIGYKAAIVIAKEASRLRMFINNQLVFDRPIGVSDRIERLSASLPEGLLRPGANIMRIQAIQRHRTDCSIAATYELRTEIDNASTALHFAAASAGRLKTIDDLRTVGPDATGTVHLRIIAPEVGDTALTRPLLRFAQAASVLIGMPNETVTVADKVARPGATGTLTVALGTAAGLRDVLQAVPPEAAVRPVVTFIDDTRLGPATLVVSGPTSAAVAEAVDGLVAVADHSRPAPRMTLSTSHWFAPDAPLLRGESHLPLSGLGVFTQEFSGRRFKASFVIGMPSDFYAEAYGKATLMLDAAYSPDVEPGSHLDVSVNGHIAATTPITLRGGDTLRHLPIRIPLANMRPGPNLITFEAQLLTTADDACAPGTSANATRRFAFFDSSEFVMPDFARIAQAPNLAALTAVGFPYNRTPAPTPLVLYARDPDVIAAAATLLGRMADAAGRVLAVEPMSGGAGFDSRDAIIVGPATQIPPETLRQLGVADRVRTDWKEAPVVGAPARVRAVASTLPPVPDDDLPGELRTESTFDLWRNASAGGHGNGSALQEWFRHTFDLSFTNLRLLPGADPLFEAPPNSTALLVQGTGAGGGTWTLLTAPTSRLLRGGAAALTAQAQWTQLAGRAVGYGAGMDAIDNQPVGAFAFVPTQPVTFGNLRLIAANWLSENILAFSLALLAACVLLGLATSVFLGSIGRQSPS